MLPEQIAAGFAALTSKDVVAVHRLSGGSRLPSWQVVTRSASYAVRLYPDAQPAHRQTRLLRRLARESLFVPEVVLVGTHESRHVLVLGWVAGTTVAEALRAEPEQAHRFGVTFGTVQARLHAVPITPDVRAGLGFVAARVEGTAKPVLVHLDDHPENVMTDGRTVTGVIDWENVRLGDARYDLARYDLARTLSILCIDPSIRALPRAQRVGVRDLRQGYLAGYREGRTTSSSSGPLAPFLAWAGGFMLADLSHRLEPPDAETIRRWADRWTRRTKR